MRIIAGKNKGKKLNSFELSSTRPTSDKIREALFDKLGTKVENCDFLDLFAGTGAVGIEAISRGAKDVFFVDENKTAIALVKKNLSLISATDKNVYLSNFEKALLSFKKSGQTFDIIFVDPPYASNFAEQAIEKIREMTLLNTNGILVWEHDANKNLFIEKNYSNVVTKKYGDKFLTYFKNTDIYAKKWINMQVVHFKINIQKYSYLCK